MNISDQMEKDLDVHDDSWHVNVVNGSEGKTNAVKNGDKRYA